MRHLIIIGAIGFLLSANGYADDTQTKANNSNVDPSTTLIDKTTGSGSSNWSDYRSGDAPGEVSATGMLGMNGSTISTIGSVKELTAALVSSAQNSTALALAWTPGRSSISPMSLATYLQKNTSNASGEYSSNLEARLLRMADAITIGYAQNNTSISSATYKERAVSIQTTGYWTNDDDPIIAIDKALSDPNSLCQDYIKSLAENQPTVTKIGGAGTGKTQITSNDAQLKCNSAVKANLRWNPSTYSLSYATGWIEPASTDGKSVSLGQATVASASYGFGNTDNTANTGYLLTLAYKWTRNEPTLSTLGSNTITRQNSGLWYGRFSGGSKTLRLIFEGSDTKTTSNTTSSQLAFKEALGFDYQVSNDVWLSFRYGRQNSTNGSTTTNGGMLNLSFSPSSTIK